MQNVKGISLRNVWINGEFAKFPRDRMDTGFPENEACVAASVRRSHTSEPHPYARLQT